MEDAHYEKSWITKQVDLEAADVDLVTIRRRRGSVSLELPSVRTPRPSRNILPQ